MGTKVCIRCDEEKEESNFSKKAGKSSRIGVCKPCKKKRNRANKIVRELDMNRVENINKNGNRIVLTNMQRQWEEEITLNHAKELFVLGFANVIEPNYLELTKKREMKNYLFEIEKYTCAYCGKYGDTVDHVRPSSKGGLDLLRNWVVSCKGCNQDKGRTAPAVYLKNHPECMQHFINTSYYRQWSTKKFKESIMCA